MEAIRIHAYGGPDVLVYEDAPRPQPAATEVVVRVHAAGVNPVDRFTRAGYLQGMTDFALPFIPGLDLSGVVDAVGSEVDGLAVGDEVFGYSNMLRQGAYAEYAVVGVGELAVKPAGVDFITAAALPLVGMSAWQSLFDIGDLQAGDGAGPRRRRWRRLAGRAARRGSGARVLGTAGSDKLDLLRELGVSEAIDYTTTRFEDVASEVDLVLDTVGGELSERSLTVLKPGGILITTAGQPDADAAAARGVRARGVFAQRRAAQLSELARLVDDGTVKAVVSTVLPLAQARQAHDLLEAGHTRGKIVLRVVA